MQQENELSPVELAILLSLSREQLIALIMGFYTELSRAMSDEELILLAQTACLSPSAEGLLLTMYAGQPQDWQSN